MFSVVSLIGILCYELKQARHCRLDILGLADAPINDQETVCSELAFLTADIFASFGVLPLLHLRAYTLQDATVYTCSYLYSGNFIISTVKSRYSHCFTCLKLFNEDRQYPKNGRFWP